MPAIWSWIEKLNPRRVEKNLPPLPPAISRYTAALLIAIYALSYFVPWYFFSTARPSPALNRDAPSVIRARVRSVLLACLASCAVTFLVLVRAGKSPASPSVAIHLMGIWPPALADSVRALFLTVLLFSGPLFENFAVQAGWRDWWRLHAVKEVWSEWTVWRNIVVGPVTEEILFRTASIPLMLLAQFPLRLTILLPPLFFGLAHFHHFYEFCLTHPSAPFAGALLRSALQFSYTTLFGAYAVFLYLRTGSLFAVCVVHAFCNAMGLPRLWGAVELPTTADGSVYSNNKVDDDAQRTRAKVLLFTGAYYVLLVVGAVLWWKNLFALTDGPNALLSAAASGGWAPNPGAG